MYFDGVDRVLIERICVSLIGAKQNGLPAEEINAAAG